MIIEIPLTQGKVALIDDADLPLVSGRNWTVLSAKHIAYAQTRVNGKTILMHRVITQCPKGLVVDHIDGNGFNNQRANLRICTHAQNLANSSKHAGKSTYKGVQRRDYGWEARIGTKAERKYLGHFRTEVEAAKAYDAAAREMYGEYARLNFAQ